MSAKTPRIATRSVSEKYAWSSSLTLRVTKNPGQPPAGPLAGRTGRWRVSADLRGVLAGIAADSCPTCAASPGRQLRLRRRRHDRPLTTVLAVRDLAELTLPERVLLAAEAAAGAVAAALDSATGSVAAACSTGCVCGASGSAACWLSLCSTAPVPHWPLAHSEVRRARSHWASAVEVSAAERANTASSRSVRIGGAFLSR